MSKGYVYKLESTIENDNRYYYGCTLRTIEERMRDDKLRRV